MKRVKRARLSEAQIWLVGYLSEKWPCRTVYPEYQFHTQRKWRFDVALIDYNVGGYWAFEIEGGIWTGGAHTRGKHFLSDAEKYNTAAAMGWKVFRFTPEQILKGNAKTFIESNLWQ